ncbi:hypothetical protein JOQ06_023476, partial [Pogonophryne albipinna]
NIPSCHNPPTSRLLVLSALDDEVSRQEVCQCVSGPCPGSSPGAPCWSSDDEQEICVVARMEYSSYALDAFFLSLPPDPPPPVGCLRGHGSTLE